MIQRWVFLASFVLAGTAAAAGPVTFDRHYSVRVDVDARGAIVAAVPQGDIPEELLPSVHAAAMRAEFEPATRAGVAVPSRTSVNVAVRYERGGHDYRATVTGVRGGGGWQMRQSPPEYPRKAFRQGYGAKVMVLAVFGSDGVLDRERTRIEQVEVQRDRPRPGNREAVPFEDAFRAATAAAMKGWSYSPDEVDGVPMAARFHVPVMFCAEGMGPSCDHRFTRASDARAFDAASEDASVRLATLKPSGQAAGAAAVN